MYPRISYASLAIIQVLLVTIIPLVVSELDRDTELIGLATANSGSSLLSKDHVVGEGLGVMEGTSLSQSRLRPESSKNVMPSDLSSTDLEEESIAQQVSKLNLNQHSIDARSFGQVPMVMEMKDLYPLDKPEHIHQLAFFKRSTQIQDPIQLKQHIMGVAEEAFQVFPYPCIYGFAFCYPSVLNHNAYKEVVQKVISTKSNEQSIFLDVGCFVGSDIRQLIDAGYKRRDVLGVDLIDNWMGMGEDLFRDQGVPFIKGDVLDEHFLKTPTISNQVLKNFKTDKNPSKLINLESIQSLNDLKSSVKFITSNKFFHLFEDHHQLQLAQKYASLLDHSPGSMIFGSQVGLPSKGTLKIGDSTMYAHSPESWKQMWYKIYKPEEVEIEAYLTNSESLAYMKGWSNVQFLWWSIKIL